MGAAMTTPTRNDTFDLAVVGAGIVGLAHARAAARSGARVVICERDAAAASASVRNFGMIFPLGQPFGELRDLALASREIWLETAAEAGIRAEPCGALLLAHRGDEAAVLEEFAAAAPDASAFELLEPGAVAERSPAVRRDGLRAGLWSPAELAVDPREALPGIARWLKDAHGVDVRFETCVLDIEPGRLRTARGETLHAERILVAAGREQRILFPTELEAAGMVPCKLHMMRTVPQPSGWRSGPHLAAGLTLRHYTSFADCPSTARLRARVAEESPELDRFGVHVMASQDREGHLVLGDSHEYGTEVGPFQREEIDELILRELRPMLDVPNWALDQRWTGVYAKHPERSWVEIEAMEGVRLVTGVGGNGMTLSFGLAEEIWTRWTTSDA